MNVVAKVTKKVVSLPHVTEKVCEKMKRDLKLLIESTGKKAKEGKHELGHDLDSLAKKLLRHHINLSASSLKKLLELVTGKRKLSLAARNRLALFAGFQSWSDLEDAIHGNTDASVNYK